MTERVVERFEIVHINHQHAQVFTTLDTRLENLRHHRVKRTAIVKAGQAVARRLRLERTELSLERIGAAEDAPTHFFLKRGVLPLLFADVEQDRPDRFDKNARAAVDLFQFRNRRFAGAEFVHQLRQRSTRSTPEEYFARKRAEQEQANHACRQYQGRRRQRHVARKIAYDQIPQQQAQQEHERNARQGKEANDCKSWQTTQEVLRE